MSDDLFAISLRPDGDLAGVFEYDGRAAFFYRYDQSKVPAERVTGAVRVFVGPTSLAESDLDVRWNRDRSAVGLFIRGVLWAAFTEESAFVGNYASQVHPEFPTGLASSFE